MSLGFQRRGYKADRKTGKDFSGGEKRISKSKHWKYCSMNETQQRNKLTLSSLEETHKADILQKIKNKLVYIF